MAEEEKVRGQAEEENYIEGGRKEEADITLWPFLPSQSFIWEKAGQGGRSVEICL